jgi:hypothetical protein
MNYIFPGLLIVGGIIFFIWCLKIHKKSPHKKWLIAAGILSAGIIYSGATTVQNIYKASTKQWNIPEDDSHHPTKK